MRSRSELIQAAAEALGAAQHEELGHTLLDATNEGVNGRFALERLLNEVRDARRAGHGDHKPTAADLL